METEDIIKIRPLLTSHNYFTNIKTETFQGIQSQIEKQKWRIKSNNYRENEKQHKLFYVSENISSSYLSMMGSPKATFKLQISETTSPYFILRQRNKTHNLRSLAKETQ
jgi:glycerophosphoryl diester phosphodiesterase